LGEARCGNEQRCSEQDDRDAHHPINLVMDQVQFRDASRASAVQVRLRWRPADACPAAAAAGNRSIRSAFTCRASTAHCASDSLERLRSTRERPVHLRDQDDRGGNRQRPEEHRDERSPVARREQPEAQPPVSAAISLETLPDAAEARGDAATPPATEWSGSPRGRRKLRARAS
jgi:hypothetical protein